MIHFLLERISASLKYVLPKKYLCWAVLLLTQAAHSVVRNKKLNRKIEATAII